MKKMLIISLMIGFFFVIDATYVSNIHKKETLSNEIKFIYISYLEYLNNFESNSSQLNKSKIDKMIDNVAYYKFNAIFLHVSPFSDAIYKSKTFPYSYTLTGQEGKNPGFDYLDYFIKKAHSKNIKVHAWINPYRISNKNSLSSISLKNPAYKLLNTENVSVCEKGIYYDPTSEIVKELIINQVVEILDNYNVDGIHFDDYFYIDYDIDTYEYKIYKENNGKYNLKDYRLMHTNDLIKRIRDVIKKKDKNLIFSISPDGNINNNYNYHYADVKKWLSDGYVDIIMPQIYYGFENQYLPFEKAYNNWKELIVNENVKLVPVLAFYKVGIEDKGAGNGKDEWLEIGVINKQIEFLKRETNYAGFGLFRYDFIFNDDYVNKISRQELKNMPKIM